MRSSLPRQQVTGFMTMGGDMPNNIELQPGDMVYFDENLALGVLLSSHVDCNGQTCWLYSLRSPRKSNLEHHLVNNFQTSEENLIKNIMSGQLKYYAV